MRYAIWAPAFFVAFIGIARFAALRAFSREDVFQFSAAAIITVVRVIFVAFYPAIGNLSIHIQFSVLTPQRVERMCKACKVENARFLHLIAKSTPRLELTK